MTKSEKLLAIAEMKVDVKRICPDVDYGLLKVTCKRMGKNSLPLDVKTAICGDCWINALEG